MPTSRRSWRISAKRFRTSISGVAADLIAEGGYVVCRWEGGATHSGPAFSDFLLGSFGILISIYKKAARLKPSE